MKTDTITLEDPETGEEYEYSVEICIKCEHCGHVWETNSEMRRPTCPSCSRKTDRSVILQYHFFSKQTCWISERLTVEQLYEMASEYISNAGIAIDSDEFQLLIDASGKFAITTSDSSERVSVEFSYRGFRSADVPANNSTLKPVEEANQESENWPSRPPQDPAPYIASMRDQARRLEVLTEHGWELSDADGEHLYFVQERQETASRFKVSDELE